METLKSLLVIILTGYMLHTTESSNDSDIKHRQRRFGGPMGGGGPFHGGGAMGGAMSGPMGGPMGGLMRGMTMGSHAPGMGPSMGGPNKLGQGSAVFTSQQGFQCAHRDVVCPKWCLVEDENGCKSCPCGPAGGMSAMAGGPSGGPMGGMMSAGVHTSQLTGANTGFTGNTGGSNTVSGTSGTTAVSGGSKPVTGASHTSSGVSSTNYIIIGGSHTTGVSRPVHECKATLLCASTCSGYQLGTTTNTGCRSCTCPSSHHVSTTTIHYIVQPTVKECTSTAYCMRTCHSGYVMKTTDTHGCPVCTCLQVEKPYKPPIEIAVEPPPYHETIPTATVMCAIRSCAAGCKVGYKCGTDGCPTCECIHPAGLTTVHQVYIERPRSCSRQLACTSSCSIGYKCDTYGCPSCECLVHVTNTYTQTRPQYLIQTKPQYIVQTCTHTLTCASTCTYGYTVVKDGTGGCGKCECKPQIIYAVQRPKPQYQIVRCQTSSACAASCSHGYELLTGSGPCPECRCKPAPVYTYTSTGCGSACTETNGNALYIAGSGGLGSGYSLNTGDTGENSYVLRNNNNVGVVMRSNVGSYQSDSLSCPPLPPNCDPSCIKYDTPHCRKCECQECRGITWFCDDKMEFKRTPYWSIQQNGKKER